MKVIKDIRFYRSRIENVPGNSFPESFYNLELCRIAERVAWKLRESGFVLGDYHHLYINLTTCKVEGKIRPSARGKDPYFPWYRYYDVEVSQELFDSLETHGCIEQVVGLLEQVLNVFATNDFNMTRIHDCINEAVTKGEKMTVVFKEKTSSKNKAIVYLRVLDNGRYFPLLRVYDVNDNVILERDLPETNCLDPYGEIQLSSRKVTIKPRKNCLAVDLEPMTFELV